MDEILQQLGLTHLLSRFQENQISPSEIINLTEIEFIDLGVTRIGDRARIRAKCRDLVAETPQQAWEDRLPGNLPILCGMETSCPIKAVSKCHHKQGRGTHKIDFHKQDRLSDMKERITKLFFPSGRNETQNLNLSELSAKLSNYSGTPVEQIMDGGDFTAEDYYRAMGTHPVRIYLVTSPVNQDCRECTPSNASDASNVDASNANHSSSTNTNDGNSTTNSANSNNASNTTTPFVYEQQHIGIISTCRDETQESILIRLGSKINTEGRKNIINVSRDDLLSGAKRGFQRASFKEESQLSVRFSGENGIDDGGPSREIMRLALRELRDSCIFTGPPDSRNIQVDVAVSPDDIDDPDLKEKVQRIADATDEAGCLEALVCVQDIVDFIGALALSRYVKQKELVQALTTHIVVKRIRDIIEQFKDGLRTPDVLNQMETYPRTMKGFFTATDRPEVDAVQVDSLFTIIFTATDRPGVDGVDAVQVDSVCLLSSSLQQTDLELMQCKWTVCLLSSSLNLAAIISNRN
ncbi:uncharacterized protein LOC124278095 [Haliotis rubra]|uniref:uncharacterized protein LOC124278095 n=1 Tax=Haliotis rubra TaxID=36100 RepID=UPI001EE51E0A|nr:uncharacterized protein LOC124278095 [Haliotis rubra]